MLTGQIAVILLIHKGRHGARALTSRKKPVALRRNPGRVMHAGDGSGENGPAAAETDNGERASQELQWECATTPDQVLYNERVGGSWQTSTVLGKK